MVGLGFGLAMRTRDILMPLQQGSHYSRSKQVCVLSMHSSYKEAGGFRRGRSRENKNSAQNSAPVASLASHASDPDRRLYYADFEHGAAAVARHFHATIDA